MIEVAHVSKRYGDLTAVSDVSFTAATGKILGFLGPNGAGKTTTMRIITGFLPATSGTVITHQGFLLAYVEDADEGDNANGDERERRLPAMTDGQALALHALDPRGHETSPPPRYTEASLVKKLEELGVGRPSTYASIIGTIEDRGYVWKKGSALVPSFTAFAVVSLLEQHFPDLVDYAFTARMEDDLDDIVDAAERANCMRRAEYDWGTTGGVEQRTPPPR